MVDPKRPSGSRQTAMMTLCPEQERFESLESRMADAELRLSATIGRIDVLDGNGKMAAEGGAVGRLKRDMEELSGNMKKTMYFTFTTLALVVIELAVKLLK